MKNDDLYGPGDDNYGRNKPFWKKNQEMDKCVMCGEETIYPKNMHIDYRMYYVEGVGQLCRECYKNIYDKK
jgi:hypothetical protein